MPACTITSKTRTRLFEKTVFSVAHAGIYRINQCWKKVFCCCGITNLKLLFGMYGHIFCLFVCLSLTRPHRPELLFLAISWIQNFTQHVEMKKFQPRSNLRILGTAGQGLSKAACVSKLPFPNYKERVL